MRDRASPATVALALSLAISVSNGMGRFAYALVLPAMQADLGLSYTEAGWLGTSNAVGYLLGAIASFWIVRHVRQVRLLRSGVVICSLAVLGTAATSDFRLLSLLRFLAGLAGAPVFICAGALTGALSSVVEPDARRLVAIVYAVGGGIGIVAAGLLVPPVIDVLGNGGWRWAWVALGGFSLAALPPIWWASGRIPATPGTSRGGGARWPWRRFMPMIAAYALFGIGYIGYMTFVIAWARKGGAGTAAIMVLWSALGLATIVSPFALSPVTARARRGGAMAVAMAIVASGSSLGLLADQAGMLVVSALLFGLGMFMVPTTVAQFVGSTLPKMAWGVALSVMTVVFSAGQIVGPVLAGLASDAAGSLGAGLALGIGLLSLGTVIALAQRDIPSHPQ